MGDTPQLTPTAKKHVGYLKQLGYEIRFQDTPDNLFVEAAHHPTHTMCFVTYEKKQTPSGALSLRFVDALFPGVLALGSIPPKAFPKVAQLVPAAREQGFTTADLIEAVNIVLRRPPMTIVKTVRGNESSYTFTRQTKTGATVQWQKTFDEFDMEGDQ